MRHLRTILPTITLALLFVACTPANILPPPLSSSSYPAPKATNPLAQPYPITTPTRDASIIPFSINKPLHEGDTQITGTGPAGVPISLQDVTFMGTVLAQTVIGSDDTFMFQVTALEKSHRIGIALGDLTGTRWKAEDFNNPAYQGEEPVQVPQVGFFYDTALVRAK